MGKKIAYIVPWTI